MDIILILIPIIAALISSYLTYYFAIKSKKTEAILKFKEEKYSNLIIFFQGFIGNTASGETKKKFFEEQYKSWLYCSDGVVKSINEMLQIVINQQKNKTDIEKGKNIIGNVILEMRKDLLGKTKLSAKDFTYIDVIDR